MPARNYGRSNEEKEKIMEEPSHLTRKERRALKRQHREERLRQKEEARLAREKKQAKKRKIKTISIWTLVVFIAGGFIYGIITLATGERTQPFSRGQVHWHADINVFICGEQIPLPKPPANQHLGTPLLHTHDDGQIHVEGIIRRAEDITLSRYMDAIGKKFNNEELLDKQNGDLCNGEKATVKLYVDGKESTALGSHIIKDGERYELRFEP